MPFSRSVFLFYPHFGGERSLRLFTKFWIAIVGVTMAVLLLAEPTHADAAAALLEQSGVLVLPIDAPESLIVQTIRLLAAVRIQLEQMQHKTKKLEAKVADIRIINRAKLLLVQHLQMTETEAHKYIEKQAMDTSMRRRTIAENIIRTYED